MRPILPPLLPALLLLAGCAAAGLGGGHVPAAGEYAYTGEYRLPDGRVGRTFTGTLLVREATPERITGAWVVPGFQRELQIGAYHDGAYVASADVTEGGQAVGTFQHRLSRGEGGALRCAGEFVTATRDDVVTYPATCSLTRVGR